MKYWNSKLLEQLLQVQDTDLKIRKLEEQIQVYNQRSKEEDAELSRIKQDIAGVDEAIAGAESQNQMYSSTLEDIRSAIKGLLTTKAGVPKPRTRSSTEALKIEEEKLESLVEETTEQLVGLREDRETLIGRAATRTEELETESGGPEAEIRKLQLQVRRLEKQREEEVSGIPSLLLKHYDRLRSSRSGIGLTILKDGVCTVCCMQMPTAIISKLSHGEKISMCPACGRMVARIEHTFASPSDEEEGADRPSRRLKRVKASKTGDKSESEDDRKAALKKTLKRTVERKLAARAEAEADRAASGERSSSGTRRKKKSRTAKAVSAVAEAEGKKSQKAATQSSSKKATADSGEKTKKSASGASAKKQGKKAAASDTKSSAKKTAVKTPAAKKPAKKTVAAEKPAAKKPPAKKAVKKPAVKKATTKKAVASKAPAKKAAKKPAAKKKVAAKKPAAKKPAAKKPAAKKPAKKPAEKKPAAKKPAAPKAASKKAIVTKAAAKKSGNKKPAKKSVAKKPAKGSKKK